MVAKTRSNKLRHALTRTRRGAVSVNLTGPYGIGRSYFAHRALETLQLETDAIVLTCTLHPGDRERTYYPLYLLLRAALVDQSFVHLPTQGPTGGPPDSHEVFTSVTDEDLAQMGASKSTPRRDAKLSMLLGSLALTPLVHSTLFSLLQAWSGVHGDAKLKAERFDLFEGGPLRIPETRRHLLRHAMDSLLRKLIVRAQQQRRGHTKVPIIIAIDGYEHADRSSHSILEALVAEGRSLPLMVVQSHDGDPSASPVVDDQFMSSNAIPSRDESTKRAIEVHLEPFSRMDTESYIQQNLGRAPDAGFVERLFSLTQGSPLFLRETLRYLRRNNAKQEGAVVHLSPVLDLPTSFTALLGSQIDALSRNAKMALAICAVLGDSFPLDVLRASLPGEFDLDGAFAELLGGQILIAIDAQRLRFGVVEMRQVATRRLHAKHIEALHQRIAELLDGTYESSQGNDETMLAVHSLRGGQPLKGIDHLLDAADNAILRREPELALRRFRRVQQWIDRYRKRKNPTENGGAELPVRDIRAGLGILRCAKQLGIRPQHSPDAIVHERFPMAFLDILHSEVLVDAPQRLLAEAATAAGEYLLSCDLHQSARKALQMAVHFARADGDDSMIVDVEMKLSLCLLRLGKLGQAFDIANACVTKLRSIPPPPPITNAAQRSIRLSQPLTLMGEISIERGQYTRANDHLNNALQAASSDGDLDQLHAIHTHQARLHHLQGYSAKTVAALERAIDIAVKAHDHRAQARLLYNLGVSLLMHRQIKKGHHNLLRASVIAQALAWKDFVALLDDQLQRLAPEL